MLNAVERISRINLIIILECKAKHTNSLHSYLALARLDFCRWLQKLLFQILLIRNTLSYEYKFWLTDPSDKWKFSKTQSVH